MSFRYSPEDVVVKNGRTTLAPKKKRANKMNARRTVVDNISFASGAEARRYSYLKLQERGGTIRDLEVQPRFVICPAVTLGGRRRPAARYTADFRYVVVATGESVTEDVKGMQKTTEAYRLRIHLVRHLYGVEVKEIRK